MFRKQDDLNPSISLKKASRIPGNQEFQKLISQTVENTYENSQNMFIEGNPSFGIYEVTDGAVKIFNTSKQGKEVILDFKTKGQFLDLTPISGAKSHLFSAEAVGKTKVRFYDLNLFFELLKLDQDFNHRTLSQLNSDLLHKSEMNFGLKSQDSFELTKNGLKRLSQSLKGTAAHKKLRRQDYANYLGLATETFIRILGDLKDQDLVEVDGREIKVKY